MSSINTFAGVYTVPGPISATATAVAAYNAIGGASSGFTQQTVQTGTTRTAHRTDSHCSARICFTHHSTEC